MEIQKLLSNCSSYQGKVLKLHQGQPMSDLYYVTQENNLLTYAVSAKTSEGVNLCFQKIAAELVGIRYVQQYSYKQIKRHLCHFKE